MNFESNRYGVQSEIRKHALSEIRASIVSICLLVTAFIFPCVMQGSHARESLIYWVLGILIGWNLRTLFMEYCWLKE